MRLILKLGDREIDSIYLPADKEQEINYLIQLTKELLDRNQILVSSSMEKPCFYVESNFFSGIPKQHRASDN